MITIHHLNCGTLLVPKSPTVVCHCLLLEEDGRLALVDTGIGLLDVRSPNERLGQPLVAMAGFQFHESDTAVRRLEAAGFDPRAVTDILLTHGDPDHTGGLADFPDARVHVGAEELTQVAAGHPRYVAGHFLHRPRWAPSPPSARTWFEMEARPIDVGFSSEVLLIPLFGHTLGHCGVAVSQGDRWLLHVGDAYYLRVELERDDHPVSQLAAQRADDDAQRLRTLERLRKLVRNHGSQLAVVGYHDIEELPPGYPLPQRT